MTEVKFSDVWNIIIKPRLEKELAGNKSFQPTDTTKNGSKSRRNIESLYNSMRKIIKRHFMLEPEKLLDRHKIAACFYIAVVNSPLIKVYRGSLEKDIFVNANLAFYISTSILLSYMNKNAKTEYSLFLKNNGLLFPYSKNSDSNESYLIQTIKVLCYAQRRGSLNVLMLANIFFLLESYTDSIYMNNFTSTLLRKQLIKKIKEVRI